jgi:UTP--glucose-1-phosphate uridylyltransferase
VLKQLGHKVCGLRLRAGERRYDIGNFESYFTAFIDFALADEKYGYMVRQYLKRKAREL